MYFAGLSSFMITFMGHMVCGSYSGLDLMSLSVSFVSVIENFSKSICKELYESYEMVDVLTLYCLEFYGKNLFLE